TVKEPLLLRLAGAAELEAVMTGTSPRQKLLPQAPRTAVERTLARLLSTGPAAAGPNDAAAPALVELVSHGPRARRRRYVRTLTPVALLAVVLIAISLAGSGLPAWIWVILALLFAVAIPLAEDRYRGLGHAVLHAGPTWLITRHGSLDRDRDCLEAPGIIGWTVRRTF
ncbi:PH domain-containing protein, partial [Nocardia gipuzkoensis]